MDSKPPTISTPEHKPEILTFEEFIFRDADDYPYYRNFFLHFIHDGRILSYKDLKYYKKFKAKNVDLNKLLCNKIKRLFSKNKKISDNHFLNSLKPIEGELYEAYKIMRSYGVSDEELFR